MPKPLQRASDWVHSLGTAHFLATSAVWLVSAALTALTVLVAWLRDQDPIFLFVIGLFSLAAFMYVLEKIRMRPVNSENTEAETASEKQQAAPYRNKPFWLTSFALAVVIVLIGTLPEGPESASDAQPPENPTALLFAHSPQIVSNPTFEPRTVTSINFRLENAGPEIAREAIWNHTDITVAIPSSATEERDLLDRASAAIAASLASSDGRRDIVPGPNGTMLQTSNLYFTDNVAEQLRNETMRLYFLVRAEWQDSAGAHVAEKCVYMPGPKSITSQAWRLCGSHNYTR